jgi:hypothetical protein
MVDVWRICRYLLLAGICIFVLANVIPIFFGPCCAAGPGLACRYCPGISDNYCKTVLTGNLGRCVEIEDGCPAGYLDIEQVHANNTCQKTYLNFSEEEVKMCIVNELNTSKGVMCGNKTKVCCVPEDYLREKGYIE